MSNSDFEMVSISAIKLAELIENQPGDLTTIDVRGILPFSEASIQNSFAVRLSKLLLRRLSANKISIDDVIVDRDGTWASHSPNSIIVCYDESTDSEQAVYSASNSLHVLMKSLSASGAPSLFFLKGGFRAFLEQFPALVTRSEQHGADNRDDLVTAINVVNRSCPPPPVMSVSLAAQLEATPTKRCIQLAPQAPSIPQNNAHEATSFCDAVDEISMPQSPDSPAAETPAPSQLCFTALSQCGLKAATASSAAPHMRRHSAGPLLRTHSDMCNAEEDEFDPLSHDQLNALAGPPVVVGSSSTSSASFQHQLPNRTSSSESSSSSGSDNDDVVGQCPRRPTQILHKRPNPRKRHNHSTGSMSVCMSLNAPRARKDGAAFSLREELVHEAHQPLAVRACHQIQHVPQTPVLKYKNVMDARISRINDFLYIGSARDAADEKLLRDEGITRIINVTPDCPNHMEHDSAFHYLRIAVSDTWNQNLQERFPEAFSFIDEARRNHERVLVHCRAGVSRSAAIVIGYLMYSQHISLQLAFDVARARRDIISPNLDFMGELREYQDHLGIQAPAPLPTQ